MPKVASEVKVQAHSGVRSHSRFSEKAGAGDPFAALLDTVASNERPAPKPDRVDQPRQSRKSEAPETHAMSADDAPAAQDTSAAPADAPAAEKTEGQGQDISVAETAATEPAPSDTKDNIDAGLAAAIDAAVQVTPAPQIVQAAIVAAPVFAPAEAAPTTGEAVPAVAAPAAEIAAAAKLTPAVTPLPDAAKAAADPAEGMTTPTPEAEATDESAPPAPEFSALQKQSRDGAPAKADAPAKDAMPAKPETAAAPETQAKPEHADLDITPKSAHVSATPDNAPSFTLSSLHAHATANAAAASATPVVNAVPLAGLAVEIAAQARAGGNRFEIRLDPPELGRIDVRLDVDKNGQVTTHLRVDRVETLDMLRRDAQNLERTLQDAGLKMSGNALNFSLRDQSPHQHANEHRAPNSPQLLVDEAPMQVGGAQVSTWATRLGGIDIRV